MKKYVVLFCAVIGSAVAQEIHQGWVPISFYRKHAYVGFIQKSDGSWGDLGCQEVCAQSGSCPRVFNPSGSYSVTFVAKQYDEPLEFKGANGISDSQNFIWIPTQILFNALSENKRLIKLSENNVIVLDKQLYDALITPESMNRLRQIIPSVGGVCVVDICCIDRRGK